MKFIFKHIGNVMKDYRDLRVWTCACPSRRSIMKFKLEPYRYDKSNNLPSRSTRQIDENRMGFNHNSYKL